MAYSMLTYRCALHGRSSGYWHTTEGLVIFRYMPLIFELTSYSKLYSRNCSLQWNSEISRYQLQYAYALGEFLPVSKLITLQPLDFSFLFFSQNAIKHTSLCCASFYIQKCWCTQRGSSYPCTVQWHCMPSTNGGPLLSCLSLPASLSIMKRRKKFCKRPLLNII